MMRRIYSTIFILALYLIIPSASAKVIELVSGRGGQQSFSADGRFVAFESRASNLVPGDTNNKLDIFVYDRDAGITERVSVSSTGEEQSSDLYSAAFDGTISADGRVVAFVSSFSNLVPGDTNNRPDIFVHDRETGITERVNVSSTGVQANNRSDLRPSLSADGRFVAFNSYADNLVDGDTNDGCDIFVHDRDTGITERVNVSSSGEQTNYIYYNFCFSPSLSADGRFVAFSSYADNLVGDDTNNSTDVFIHDRDTGITERVSVSSSGEQMESSSISYSLSADGRFVAFSSNNEIVFVRDRNTGVTEQIIKPKLLGRSYWEPSLSADGRFVALATYADDMVPGDTNGENDIFVYDRESDVTERVNVSSKGMQANYFSHKAIISPDGRFVAFESRANNLVPGGDKRKGMDLFVAENTLVDLSDDLTVTLRSTSGTTQVGEYIRFRARLTNNSDSTLSNCKALLVNPLLSNYQREFSYFSWPLNVTNAVINGTIDIAPGETGQFSLAVLPRVAMRREVRFEYICDNTKAIPIPFINSVHLTAKTEPLITEDFVQLKNSNHRTELVIDRNNSKYWAEYSVNVINSGNQATSVKLTTTSNFLDSILRQSRLCEPLDPANNNWSCINPRDTQLQVDLEPGETKKILVYLHAQEPIDRRVIQNRLYLEARDRAGELVAKTSMGISTIN